MDYRWDIHPLPPSHVVDQLRKELNLSRPAAILAAQRGITDFETGRSFFRPGLNALYNPFLMSDMKKAAGRIITAMEEGETLLIYGDYDVDGTTAVALMKSFFIKHYPGTTHHYIPDRYLEGYGISFKGIEYAAEVGAGVLIALDCGIRAHDKIARANELGIDVIICDHHLPESTLPSAFAVLDPKRSDCQYPFKELSGCGIGFKLLHGLCLELGWPLDELMPMLDLVAVSTACDIVPVTGENRILLAHGLQRINENIRPGIELMLELAGKKTPLSVSDVVFTIGPRINAAGRIDHGIHAVNLLLANSKEEAESMAQLLETHNRERKELDKDITAEALIRIQEEGLESRSSTVLFSENWHKGVIGIVASRLTEHYYRPTIVLTESNGLAVGSARSVKGFDIHAAIDACSQHLVQFGGHMYAAGLTLQKNQIARFAEAFETVVSSRISPTQQQPSWEIDLEIDFSDITPNFFNILQQFAPFGPGNMEPLFLTRRVIDAGFTKAVGTDKAHLKLDLFQAGDSRNRMAGIAFGMGEIEKELKIGGAFDVVYNVVQNVWNERVTIELMVRDIKRNGE